MVALNEQNPALETWRANFWDDYHMSHMYQSVQKNEVCHQTIVGKIIIRNIIFKFTVLQMHIQAVLIKHD